jgi:hypothetical protein
MFLFWQSSEDTEIYHVYLDRIVGLPTEAGNQELPSTKSMYISGSNININITISKSLNN